MLTCTCYPLPAMQSTVHSRVVNGCHEQRSLVALFAVDCELCSYIYSYSPECFLTSRRIDLLYCSDLIYSVGYNINYMLLLIEYAHDVIVTVGATAVMGVHRCVYYKCAMLAMLAGGVDNPLTQTSAALLL